MSVRTLLSERQRSAKSSRLSLRLEDEDTRAMGGVLCALQGGKQQKQQKQQKGFTFVCCVCCVCCSGCVFVCLCVVFFCVARVVVSNLRRLSKKVQAKGHMWAGFQQAKTIRPWLKNEVNLEGTQWVPYQRLS